MKTISGKQNILDESILSSTKAGGKIKIEEFMSSKYTNQANYKINDDLSVDLLISNALFGGYDDIPCWFKSAVNIEIERCKIENFTLPKKANLVEIKDCANLKTIRTKEESEINTLSIENCPNVDLSGIKDLKVKVVKIFKCGIKSLKGLEGVSRHLSVRTCGKLHTYDLKCEYAPQMVFTICPLKYFNEPLCANEFTMDGCYGTKILEFNTGIAQDIKIYDQKKDLTTIKIVGNNVDTIVIDGGDGINTVSIGVDCKESLSFCNLSNIEKYEFPAKISGCVVFEEVKTIPDVNCKRIIKR